MADEARAQKRKLSASEGNFFIGGDDDAAEDERSVNFEMSFEAFKSTKKPTKFL